MFGGLFVLMRGIVVKFDATRGFGFIRCEESAHSKDAFVHISNVQDGVTLEVGQTVIFDLEQAEKGPVALRVIAGPKQKSPWAWFGMAATILIAVSMLGITKVWPSWQGAYLISINLATIFFYFYDKRVAGHPEYIRVPEMILHALALLGGTPAAFLSQYFFRHKTIKGSFRIVFWIIFVIQIMAIWYVFFSS